MKGTLIIILLSCISQIGFASKQTPLPEEPWRAIAYMEKSTPDIRWEGDIRVKAIGKYTSSDSIILENAINQFNDLCETINLSLTSMERGDLEIYFMDSTNKSLYEKIFQRREIEYFTWSYKYNEEKKITHFDLAINLDSITQELHQNILTNTLAFSLYPKLLRIEYNHKSGRKTGELPLSIYNNVFQREKIHNYTSTFSSFDRQLIKAVYAKDFSEKLAVAKKQFHLLPRWVNDNSKAVVAFPFVLTLFLFVGLIILFYKKIKNKIKSKLLLFNVLSLVSLFFVSMICGVFYELAYKLRHSSICLFQSDDIWTVILVITFFGLLAANIMRLIEHIIHRRIKQMYFKVLLMFLSTCLIPSVAIFSIYYFSPNGIRDIDINRIVTFILIFVIIGSIRALVSFFMLKEKDIKIANEVQLANLRELKTKAELNALHSKINPHFLYNALNSIAGLSKIDAEKTEQMALSLSKLFRHSINKEQSDWSTLSEEIEMVKIYLDIEKVRFDERLDFTIEIPEELKTQQVPRFIIQPLVENAIKHGISTLTEKGVIRVQIEKGKEFLNIRVFDNGPDFPTELIPGFGLQSVYDKLEILYPDRFELHFTASPNKHITIKLA